MVQCQELGCDTFPSVPLWHQKLRMQLCISVGGLVLGEGCCHGGWPLVQARQGSTMDHNPPIPPFGRSAERAAQPGQPEH